MYANTHGLAFTSTFFVPEVCLMVRVGQFVVSAKFKQTFPLALMLTFSVLVTGQLDTFVCNQFTLLNSRAGGTYDVLEEPVDEVLVDGLYPVNLIVARVWQYSLVTR
jgi:hypothetical protein